MKESGFQVDMIVAGGARGVDRAAEDISIIDKIPNRIFPADWDEYGNAAGPIRNREMADNADALIALPDSESVGTRDMITVMRKMGKPVYVMEIG